jgi:hypothetical protein
MRRRRHKPCLCGRFARHIFYWLSTDVVNIEHNILLYQNSVCFSQGGDKMFNQFGAVLCHECNGSMRLTTIDHDRGVDIIKWKCAKCGGETELTIGIPDFFKSPASGVPSP